MHYTLYVSDYEFTYMYKVTDVHVAVWISVVDSGYKVC